MFKKITLSLLIFSVLITTGGCLKKDTDNNLLDTVSKRDKLIIGVKTDSKPFGFIDKNGDYAGFDVDLSKEIAKRLLGDENKIKFVPVTTSNRILKLNSKEIDMVVATMTITSQRKNVVDFSIPYYFTSQAILTKKTSPIKSISDLNNKKVIIIYGSTAEKLIRHHAPDAKLVGFKTYESAYLGLNNDMADAILADYTILSNFEKENNYLKILSTKYQKEPYAIGLRKDGASYELKQKVNYIIDSMLHDGSITKLNKKWME